MYCINCGKEIGEDVKFCPNCGTPVHKEVQQPFASTDVPVETVGVVEDKPPKVWTVFSIIGKILGIVCLSTALIPFINYLSLGFGVVGIVMSCLGRKANTEETDKKCRIGLKLSIAAVVISFVLIIVYYVIFFVILWGSVEWDEFNIIYDTIACSVV